jgi:hypothetical protein
MSVQNPIFIPRRPLGSGPSRVLWTYRKLIWNPKAKQRLGMTLAYVRPNSAEGMFAFSCSIIVQKSLFKPRTIRATRLPTRHKNISTTVAKIGIVRNLNFWKFNTLHIGKRSRAWMTIIRGTMLFKKGVVWPTILIINC